jgi:hypothetical protein
MSEKWAGSVVELTLSVSGVSSGKRFVAEVRLKKRRRGSVATVLGPGVRGVHPVVDGGGMVANRRRGDEMLLRRTGVSVGVRFNVLLVIMDGSLMDLVSVGRR